MYLKPARLLRPCVLVVDDDRVARAAICKALTARGVAAIDAENGRIARVRLDEHRIALVVTAIFMPECDGIELIAAIRGMARPVPVIAMTDHERWTGLNFLDAANDLGAAAVIEKPFRAEALLRLIAGLLPEAADLNLAGVGATRSDRDRRGVSDGFSDGFSGGLSEGFAEPGTVPRS